jgi:hypothetical protein
MRESLWCVVLVLAVASETFGQVREQRAWVDVNFGIGLSVADEEEYAYPFTLFLENAALVVGYPKPDRGAAFDVGGGFMLTDSIGVGVSVSRTAHEGSASLGMTIPHPYFFDASANAIGRTSDELKRTETGVHVQLMAVPLETERFRVRIFGGPTFFRYRADMVQDMLGRQDATPFSRANTVSITDYELVEVDSSGVGFNVGGDVSYFFTRVFGVGGFARFTHGSLTIDEPMSEHQATATVGGTQVGGGIRLRF